MKVWKDKQGNKLNGKEFIQRWKSGLQKVTPLQQTKVQVRSTWIMVIGLIAGIIISIFTIRNLWWLLIILIGGLGNTLMQLLGLWQKKKLLENFENSLKGGNNGL